MNGHLEVGGAGEALVALIALVGSLAGVGHGVPQHVALVGAQLVAHLAPPHLHPQHRYFFYLEEVNPLGGQHKSHVSLLSENVAQPKVNFFGPLAHVFVHIRRWLVSEV